MRQLESNRVLKVGGMFSQCRSRLVVRARSSQNLANASVLMNLNHDRCHVLDPLVHREFQCRPNQRTIRCRTTRTTLPRRPQAQGRPLGIRLLVSRPYGVSGLVPALARPRSSAASITRGAAMFGLTMNGQQGRVKLSILLRKKPSRRTARRGLAL